MKSKLSKEKIVEVLVNRGNNPELAKKMTEEHFDYVKRTYDGITNGYAATIIRTIY